jgi:nitrite reductase (NADH) small subunit/3-phenylpropionate/trans-cinnamate dioxygenase ferredoxin subunit
MPFTTLCTLDELTEGLGKYVEIDGFRLAVFLHNGVVFAMDNACPHAGGSMSGGYIADGCAICPWHGWAFNLESGALVGSFGSDDSEVLKVYKVRHVERDGKTYVQAELPMV